MIVNARPKSKPPDSIQHHERGFIFACVERPEILPQYADIDVDHFTSSTYRDTWAILQRLSASGQLDGPDYIVRLAGQLRDSGTMDAVELARLVDGDGVLGYGPDFHADKLRAEKRNRDLLQLLRLAQEQVGGEGDAGEVAGSLRAGLEAFAGDDAGFISINDLFNRYPCRAKPVVHGLLRAGEVCNLIASPKVGKSWAVMQLALCVAEGRPWLGHDTAQGSVLIVDNELLPDELATRFLKVATAMQVKVQSCPVVLRPVRGQNVDIHSLRTMLSGRKGYSLIVLDALYRFLPEGTSENDNAGMMRIYNELDAIARSTGAAIVVVHHSSKGDQSGKAITDVGAGAGSISRAADTHLTIRHHEQEGLSVLEAVTRSWEQPEPISIQHTFPLWELAGVEPELKQAKGPGDGKREKTDKETQDCILKALKRRRMTHSQLRTKLGFGASRVSRGLFLLQESGQVEMRRVKKNGKRFEVAQIIGDRPHV